ncbi:MAG: hypothetical protein PHP85_11070 [Gallionella sp.]|nr:hypothetical protein [Gallionella sp.]
MDNDDKVSAVCDSTLTTLTAKYWQAYDDPNAGDNVWVLKKQVEDATLEWAKAKAKMLQPDILTSSAQLKQASTIHDELNKAADMAALIVIAARFIAFVAKV